MIVTVNGTERELTEGITVAALVAELDGPADGRGVAVAIDGQVVPRSGWATVELRAGERVEVLIAVGGG